MAVTEEAAPRYSAAWWCDGQAREWMAHLWDNVALWVVLEAFDHAMANEFSSSAADHFDLG